MFVQVVKNFCRGLAVIASSLKIGTILLWLGGRYSTEPNEVALSVQDTRAVFTSDFKPDAQ